jgi:hypothetical protein
LIRRKSLGRTQYFCLSLLIEWLSLAFSAKKLSAPKQATIVGRKMKSTYETRLYYRWIRIKQIQHDSNHMKAVVKLLLSWKTGDLILLLGWKMTPSVVSRK